MSERISSVRMITESRDSRNVLVFYEDIHICELLLLGEYRVRPLRDALWPKPITYLAKYRNQKAIFSIKQSDFQCCTYLRVSGSQETQAFKLYVYKGSIQQVQPAYTTIFTVLGLHLEKCETRYHDPCSTTSHQRLGVSLCAQNGGFVLVGTLRPTGQQLEAICGSFI